MSTIIVAMKRMRAIAGIGAWMLSLSCQKTEERAPQPPPSAPVAKTPTAADAAAVSPPTLAAPADASALATSPDWSKLVGRCVVAEGHKSGGSKTGALLIGGSWSIGIPDDALPAGSGWSALPGGSRVRVRGFVAVRADRPVFIQKKGEPLMQGIPMPEGTDLEQARRRYVLEKVSVTPLRSKAQVESALSAAIGKEVSLDGVVWSLNGHYWFNHDGIELHVEGQAAFPEWTSLHGKPVMLRGMLERRAMPRIDQIVLKPKPDLKEAFVLGLRQIAAHSDPAVTPCSD